MDRTSAVRCITNQHKCFAEQRFVCELVHRELAGELGKAMTSFDPLASALLPLSQRCVRLCLSICYLKTAKHTPQESSVHTHTHTSTRAQTERLRVSLEPWDCIRSGEKIALRHFTESKTQSIHQIRFTKNLLTFLVH